MSGRRISGNTFLNTFTLAHAYQVVISGNHGSGQITLSNGGGNEVSGNFIDGGYDGSGGHVGTDDGVLVGSESGDLIRDNTLANIFDAGVEGVGTVVDTTITGNTIVNAGFAGVGAYWCTSWSGNIVSGNAVSRSPVLIWAYFAANPDVQCFSAAGAVFTGNQIVDNRFADSTTPGASAMHLNFEQFAPGAVSNNVIQGNDLGPAPGPFPITPSGFINGGGNICALPNPFCGG